MDVQAVEVHNADAARVLKAIDGVPAARYPYRPDQLAILRVSVEGDRFEVPIRTAWLKQGTPSTFRWAALSLSSLTRS